ncbi:MAG: type II toxin-antitoxin system RelE/ParE family toxin [Opitutales bacterium]|nr:type II toxin-antitoxin system RelE/ParE family toxin [Opitutales bacterium]
MEIELHRLAEEDLLAGFHFYERQSARLGHYFLDSLYADLESLAIHAGVHRKVFGCFRLLAKTFPYAVYYRIESDRVIVFRVLDCRVDPERHKSGLGR